MPATPQIYLDHAATSWPKPAAVLDAWREYHEKAAGSPGRGSHSGSAEASRRVERVRRDLADFFALPDPARVIFTPSCTHALNLAIFGLLKKGDHVVSTAMDHNATLRPLARLANSGVIEWSVAKAAPDGIVTTDALRAVIRKTTKMVVLSHASNAVGAIQDAAGFAQIAREHGALFLLDAAQTAGLLPIDMTRLGIDLLAVPSHKALLGPSGAGALLVREPLTPDPLHFGGTGVDSASLVPAVEFPGSYEAGTGNPAGIVAWGAGIRHVADAGVDAMLQHERELILQLQAKLIHHPKIQIYGPRDATQRTGILALNISGFDSHEVASILDASFQIAVRAGVSCAPLVTKMIGAPAGGWVRVSAGYSTTEHEIAAAADAILQIADSAPESRVGSHP